MYFQKNQSPSTPLRGKSMEARALVGFATLGLAILGIFYVEL